MAASNPERELSRLKTVLQKGLPSLVLIQGPQRFFRSEAVDLCVAAAPESADLRQVDGEQDLDERVLDDLRGRGLFSAGTTVILRRGDKWLKAHGPALESLLGKIARGSALVLEIQKLDGRTKFAKTLSSQAEKFEFRDLYTEPYDRSRSPAEAEIVSWIQERARALQLPLSPEAALTILFSVGKEPAELVAELQRLAAQFMGRRQALSADDLRGRLTTSFESTPFEFAEAVLSHDRRRALRSLGAMYARGVKGRDGENTDVGGLFPFITSWMYTSLAQVYEGRCLLDDGMSQKDIPAALNVRMFQDRLLDHVARNKKAELERGLLLLQRAQRELRTTGEEPEWILDRFVQRFVREAPGKTMTGTAAGASHGPTRSRTR